MCEHAELACPPRQDDDDDVVVVGRGLLEIDPGFLFHVPVSGVSGFQTEDFRRWQTEGERSRKSERYREERRHTSEKKRT